MSEKCKECGSSCSCPKCDSSSSKHGGSKVAKKKGKKHEPKKDKGKKPKFGKAGRANGSIAEDIFSGPDVEMAD